MATTTVSAQTWSDWGLINSIEAGWVEDTIAVWHAAPMVNPSGCEVTGGGYATNPNDPGHKLFHSVALAAFLSGKEVHMLISDCIYSKPRIIAIGLR